MDATMRRTKRSRRLSDEPAPEPAFADETEDKPALTLREVVTESGREPFSEWIASVRDLAARLRILARLDRVGQSGNFGDHRKHIAGATSELRIDYGPGYRVYYVLQGNTLVLLIIGGVKDSQQSDILKAAALWEECKNDVEGFSRDFIR